MAYSWLVSQWDSRFPRPFLVCVVLLPGAKRVRLVWEGDCRVHSCRWWGRYPLSSHAGTGSFIAVRPGLIGLSCGQGLGREETDTV